ncbi:hypothetical protein F2Q70_00035956 [Brassica cretica]|uniref:Uncharacterized protein n=1 Tax=Brassica cretica TaxID=69181 RepID=A0A8S9JYJ2_BRACR|nr:hypothetical protein F2Q68_00030813 [Brassica cretica]KAF2586638.1 hypothetical protein F2Q70_00035956 [Brassica cretica]
MTAKANRRFAKIRSREERRGPYDEARLLHSQAFGTRKCLEVLKGAGNDILQATIEMFAEHERRYEQKVAKLKVGEIPEGDLKLSPLMLKSQFVDARILAGLDPYGSNAGLIDPETMANLHVSSTRPIDPIGGCGEDLTPPVKNRSIALEEEALSRGTRVVGSNAPVFVLSDTSAEGHDTPPPEESRRGNEKETGETLEEADPGVLPRPNEVRTSPAVRESSVRASELSALNDRESDREN